MPERTVLDFYRSEVSSPRGQHYAHWTPGGRRVLTTEQFFDRTAALAGALSELGVAPGDRVMLLSDNRPEWHMVDIATISLGAVDVPIYGTLTPEQIAYQLNDSGAKVVVAESPEQMAKFVAIRKKCREVKHLIQIEGPCDKGITAFDDLIQAGDAGGAEALFWDRAGRVPAERSHDHHLHLGHHRRAQGGDAHPRQSGAERASLGAPHPGHPRGPGARVPAPVPRPRADGRLHLHVEGDFQGLLLGLPRRRSARRDQTDPLRRCSPVLRKGDAEGHRQGRRSAGGQARALQLGPRTRQGKHAPSSRRRESRRDPRRPTRPCRQAGALQGP